MSVFLPILALCAAVGVGYAVKKINDHEKRPLRKGSKSISSEYMTHASFEAVVDNYVYIHNAFRNDLIRIIANCKSNAYIPGELEEWASILEVHSRFEDEVIIVALQARMKELQQTSQLPAELVDGKDHDGVKDLLSQAMETDSKDERISILKKLSSGLDEHLEREEATLVPLLLNSFSLRELWAIDSFIINPKLGYCDKDTLMKITKWWFSNISVAEAWPLLKNFIKAGKQKPMPLEEWKKIQDLVPALQKFPTEDLVS